MLNLLPIQPEFDMSPVTHLFVSWIVAAKTTNNVRDCRLIALAGVAPDLDGLGIVVDFTARAFGHQTFFWERFHHVLFHGAFGAVLTAAVFALCARDKLRVALLALVTFHLHLLCDFVGSRGPSSGDLW
ncbi:MAG TPA: metal-dependent hydrolase, partial [Candidatus Binatia bacterium]|nr:metal-dependent hydrolase [Candidatus Binatia bacterium]